MSAVWDIDDVKVWEFSRVIDFESDGECKTESVGVPVDVVEAVVVVVVVGLGVYDVVKG